MIDDDLKERLLALRPEQQAWLSGWLSIICTVKKK